MGALNCACVRHPVRFTRKSFWSQIMFCISGERERETLVGCVRQSMPPNRLTTVCCSASG